MTKADWRHHLTTMEADLGLSDGFRFVYGPLSTLKTGRIAFLSLNPGRAPSATNLREISDERGNSYDVERHTTLSPIADQALQAFAFFGAEPNEVLTGVVCPFRTPSWGDLSRSQQTRALAIGHEFWKEPLERPDIDLIICCSNDATHAVTDWLGARLETSLPAGWGSVQVHLYRTPQGVPILALPHLSRFRLFGRPQSEAAIRALFEQAAKSD
jgi:hypothetical protein